MRIERSSLACSLALVALVTIGCGGGASTPSQPAGPSRPKPAQTVSLKGDPIIGQQKFTGTCSTCHGPNGTGLPKLGKNLVTSEWAKSKTDAELLAFLKVGRPASDPLNTTKVDMPPKGGNPSLSEKDLVDIIAFVRYLQRG
jgi:disulfide bond formation protein DsbB